MITEAPTEDGLYLFSGTVDEGRKCPPKEVNNAVVRWYTDPKSWVCPAGLLVELTEGAGWNSGHYVFAEECTGEWRHLLNGARLPQKEKT